MRHDGTPDVPAILRSVGREPSQLGALVRTAIDAWTARDALCKGRRLLGVGLGCPYFAERASEPAPADVLERCRTAHTVPILDSTEA